MRKSRNRNGDGIATPDMTPMMDIVFIMLIFFIVSTSFMKVSGVEWQTPQKGEGKPSESLILRLDATGLITINGRMIDVNAVTDNVVAELIKKPYASAVVDASRLSDVKSLVATVDQIRSAGISSVQVVKH